jgi:spermidine/putrescine transport system substrate-binding protein
MNMRMLVIALLLFLNISFVQAAEKVVVYNWAEYIPDDVLKDFSKETGIDVVYSTYENNEAMYAKIKTQGGKGYDVVVPSTYLVSKMKKDGLLQPIDKTRLSNFKNLDDTLLDKPYDPSNHYSIPSANENSVS